MGRFFCRLFTSVNLSVGNGVVGGTDAAGSQSGVCRGARATLVSGFFLPPAYLAANGGACDAHSPGCVRKLFQLI